MLNPTKIREKRAQTWEQMKALLDDAEKQGRSSLTGEERASYEKMEADIADLTKDLGIAERSEAMGQFFDFPQGNGPVDLSAKMRAATGNEDDADPQKRYAKVFDKWVRSNDGNGDLEREEREILRNMGTDPEFAKQARALGIATSAAGGYLVPPGYRAELIEQTKAFGGMLQNAQILQTATGAPLQWPTVDDTANIGAILGENTQVSQQDIVFNTATLGGYTYTSKMILVSLQLLQDETINVESLISRSLANRIGRIWNQHFTTGTGSSQPLGIVTNCVVGKQGATGQTTSVTLDDLIDVQHSVDPSYRTNTKWMLSDATLKPLRKLKDQYGRYLWEPSVTAGVPDQLLSRPYVINQDMPAMAANAKSILYGNFEEAYVIRIIRDVQLLRFNERFGDYLQVGFTAFARADGTLQNASAVRAYQNSAT
jgi:HK97 family phage major capsid protein